jgi:UDP:flavonoid glycosyltransferase YjiC (YdhE family)
MILFTPEWMLLSCVCTALLARLDFGVLMKSYLEQQSRAITYQRLQEHVKVFRDQLKTVSELCPQEITKALRHSTFDLVENTNVSMDLAVLNTAPPGAAITGQVGPRA